jgi:hypothetical protein
MTFLSLAAWALLALFPQDDERCSCKEIQKIHAKKDHLHKPPPPKGPKDGEHKRPPKEGAGDEHAKTCAGKLLQEILKERAAGRGGEADPGEEKVRRHFESHSDGRCHCFCRPGGDEKPKKIVDGDAPHPPKKVPGDGPPPPPKKKPEAGQDDCACKHLHDGPCPPKKVPGDGPPPPPKKPGAEGRSKEKGNNGVGNGEDPQPPGKAPVNDGPGSGPGKPDRKP